VRGQKSRIGHKRNRNAHLILDKIDHCVFASGQHDYKRNGTTTLFAALEVLQGKVTRQGPPASGHG